LPNDVLLTLRADPGAIGDRRFLALPPLMATISTTSPTTRIRPVDTRGLRFISIYSF
jgi:hypothetical protein